MLGFNIKLNLNNYLFTGSVLIWVKLSGMLFGTGTDGLGVGSIGLTVGWAMMGATVPGFWTVGSWESGGWTAR